MIKEKPEYPNKKFLKDLGHFFGRYKFKFILLTIILAIAAIFDLIPSIIISKIIDFFTKYSSGMVLTPFYEYIGILLGIMIGSTFLRLGSKHFFINYINTVQKEAKIECFQKLMEADLFWHDKENTGNKMQKISDGTSALGTFMDFYINSGVSMIVSVIGIITIFGYFGMKYAVLAIIFMSVYLIINYIYNRYLAKKTIEVQIAKEKVAGKSYEFSSNISTVKSLGIEKSAYNEINSKEEDVLIAKKSRRKISTFKWINIQSISAIFYVLFVFMVGKDIISGLLTLGSIVIYMNYVGRIQMVLNNISNYSDTLIEVKYSIYRMMDLYHSIPILNEENAINLHKWSELNIENVGFKYKNEEVLEHFSLKIKKGERIGIVGKSGSGKSTLFKLLLKLYLPQDGMIYFNNLAITDLKKNSIAKKISIVPQEAELFNLSFKENIVISSFGHVYPKKYKKAIELSQCMPIISKLNDGDSTLIGEKGVRLSGGERQRLGIARALYKDSDIIIFDEATSNLDYETERKIQDAFDKELKDKTLIFAAHRLSTLRNMDKILVIEGGRITEYGSYKELIRRKGEFYRLLKKQRSKKENN